MFSCSYLQPIACLVLGNGCPPSLLPQVIYAPYVTRLEAMHLPDVSYDLDEFTLTFGNSSSTVGLQIADHLAGFCMRFYEKKHHNSSISIEEYAPIIKMLEVISNAPDSQGVTIVSSIAETRDFYKLAS